MATREEIVKVIDELFAGKRTPSEAKKWALSEFNKTPDCEDPVDALFELRFLTDTLPPEVLQEHWEELTYGREVLVRGVPCPSKDLGKTIEAYWLAYTPGDKIVLCQIKKEDGNRILELKEERWSGEISFHEEISLPQPRDDTSPLLTSDEIFKKKKLFRSGELSEEKATQWILMQLKRKSSVYQYSRLLGFYWLVNGPHEAFHPMYIEMDTETRPMSKKLQKFLEFLKEDTKRMRKQMGLDP